MGMAMTVLSFAMLSNCAGIRVQQLRPADLNPVSVVASVEDRAMRTYTRAVKYYESLRFVYEIQTQIKDWREKSAAEQQPTTTTAAEAGPAAAKFDQTGCDAMNCAKHSDVQATAFCRSCGKALCDVCQIKSQGTVFCEEHRPMETNVLHNDAIYGRPEYSPYTAPVVPPLPPQQQMLPPMAPRPALGAPSVASSASPGLAFILGWIPGVGAIYNGQYAKGLVHAVVFGMLVTVLDSRTRGFEPLFGMGMVAFIFYMAFEAYHTAKRRTQGIPVEEFSSLMHYDPNSGRLPLGPVLMIGFGCVVPAGQFRPHSSGPDSEVLAGGTDWCWLIPADGPRAIAQAVEGQRRKKIAMDNTLAKLIRASRGPVLLMTFGALLAIHQFSGISFDQTFPVLIIVFGMMWLLERMTPQRAGETVINVPQMAPLPPMEARDPLAYDPLREVHRNVYGDVPVPVTRTVPLPVTPPPAAVDRNQDIPTAEHPIRREGGN